MVDVGILPSVHRRPSLCHHSSPPSRLPATKRTSSCSEALRATSSPSMQRSLIGEVSLRPRSDRGRIRELHRLNKMATIEMLIVYEYLIPGSHTSLSHPHWQIWPRYTHAPGVRPRTLARYIHLLQRPWLPSKSPQGSKLGAAPSSSRRVNLPETVVA